MTHYQLCGQIYTKSQRTELNGGVEPVEIKKNQNKQARLLTGGGVTTIQSQAEKTQVKDEKVTKAGKKDKDRKSKPLGSQRNMSNPIQDKLGPFSLRRRGATRSRSGCRWSTGQRVESKVKGQRDSLFMCLLSVAAARKKLKA